MDELREILIKYKDIDIDEKLGSFDSLVAFSTVFYRDVAEIYDAVTRTRNLDRNPIGFQSNDAAILGLLVRTWKILKDCLLLRKEKRRHYRPFGPTSDRGGRDCQVSVVEW
jgi:hypothetical protein